VSVFVKTTPRLLVAEFVRIGDEIAVYPVPAKHKPSDPCDCPSTNGESRQQRHCATRHLPVRGLTFLEHNEAAVIWCRIINVRAAKPGNLWFGCPRLSITVIPRTDDGPLALARFVADQRDPMVMRQRIRVPEDHEQEGQPRIAVGITCACTPVPALPALVAAPHDLAGKPLRLVHSDPDVTQLLQSRLVPVGVQVIPHGGRSHEATPPMLDFASERESDRETGV